MTKGTLYCVGMGPGDPELITLKALRCLCHCPVLALPEDQRGQQTAAGILKDAAAEFTQLNLADKEMLSLPFPMTRDKEKLAAAHQTGAARIQERLENGDDVALITLGCPTVYASCIYIQKRVAAAGFQTVLIPGVTSFSAAAARLGQPLCEKDESLSIIPAGRSDLGDMLEMSDNTVLMKVPRHLDGLKAKLQEKGLLKRASLVERCGLPGERICPTLESLEETGYFSVILIKKGEEES